METGRIVVPASRRTRTATDLSPKTEEGKGNAANFFDPRRLRFFVSSLQISLFF